MINREQEARVKRIFDCPYELALCGCFKIEEFYHGERGVSRRGKRFVSKNSVFRGYSIIPGGARGNPRGGGLYTEEEDRLGSHKDNQKNPQVKGIGKDKNRAEHGKNQHVDENFFPPGQARFGDPPYPGAEMSVRHDPSVEPAGTLEEAERGQQQKRGGRQNGKDDTRDTQGKGQKTGSDKKYPGNQHKTPLSQIPYENNHTLACGGVG
jgi:hypothetical protein